MSEIIPDITIDWSTEPVVLPNALSWETPTKPNAAGEISNLVSKYAARNDTNSTAFTEFVRTQLNLEPRELRAGVVRGVGLRFACVWDPVKNLPAESSRDLMTGEYSKNPFSELHQQNSIYEGSPSSVLSHTVELEGVNLGNGFTLQYLGLDSRNNSCVSYVKKMTWESETAQQVSYRLDPNRRRLFFQYKAIDQSRGESSKIEILVHQPPTIGALNDSQDSKFSFIDLGHSNTVELLFRAQDGSLVGMNPDYFEKLKDLLCTSELALPLTLDVPATIKNLVANLDEGRPISPRMLMVFR